MRVVVSTVAALLASYSYGVSGVSVRRQSLLKKLGSKLRKDGPLVTQVNAFGTKEKACCGCFKSKYAWPANAGRGAAFAPKQTCDTCYVSDVYGIEAKGPVVVNIPRPAMVGGGSAPPAANGGQCRALCDDAQAPGCVVSHTEEGTGKETTLEFHGPGACEAFISNPFFIEQMKTNYGITPCEGFGMYCMSACKVNGCGGSADGAYEKTESKVQAVHEWNWNCASGNAPEDAHSWLSGPVEGEPESSRGPFEMCKEDPGWYCSFEDGPDLKLEAGADAPVEVDEGGSNEDSVATMTLPVIDGAKSVAQSATSL